MKIASCFDGFFVLQLKWKFSGRIWLLFHLINLTIIREHKSLVRGENDEESIIDY